MVRSQELSSQGWLDDLCIQEMKKIPTISPDDEPEYIARAKAGDEDALQRLISTNIGLIVKTAKRYKSVTRPLPQVINTVAIGFMEGIRRYDPAKGFKLSTYVLFWMKEECLKEIAQDHPFKLSQKVYWTTSRLRNYEEEQMSRGYSPPSMVDICKNVRTNPEEVQAIRQSFYFDALVSLDQPLEKGTPDSGKNGSLIEMIPDASSVFNGYYLQDSPRAMAALDSAMRAIPLQERETTIVKAYLGIPPYNRHTMDEVGALLNPRITRERVRQILDPAVERLTQYFKQHPFDVELELMEQR